MKKISIISVFIFCAISMSAQILSNGYVQPYINGSSVIFDASTQYSKESGMSNDLGKGIVIPSVDLVNFQFDMTYADGITFPTYFDGMIVYNNATGTTLTTGNRSATTTAVTPGFYYFSNPDGANSGTVTTGVWKPLGGMGAISGDVNIPAGSHTATVVAIQGYPVSDVPPLPGQVLMFDDETQTWTPTTLTCCDNGGGTAKTIAFSSGSNIELVVDNHTTSNMRVVGVKNAYTTEESNIYKTGVNVSLNSLTPYQATANGTLTGMYATFRASDEESFSRSSSLIAQVFTAPSGSSSFTALAGASLTIGAFMRVSNGMVMTNQITGLNIPVVSGNRYLLVFYIQASSLIDFNNLEGYVSGSITIQ